MISNVDAFLDTDHVGKRYFVVCREQDMTDSLDVDIVTIKEDKDGADEIAGKLNDSEADSHVYYYVKTITDGLQNLGPTHYDPDFALQYVKEHADIELCRFVALRVNTINTGHTFLSYIENVIDAATEHFFFSISNRNLDISRDTIREIILERAAKGIQLARFQRMEITPVVQQVLDEYGIVALPLNKE